MPYVGVYPNKALLYSSCASLCVFVVCVKAPVVCKNLSSLSGYAPLYQWSWVTVAKILCGTLANDPIKMCISAELTGDYTLQSTVKERAKVPDTVEQHRTPV